jgi:hypothetical protein
MFVAEIVVHSPRKRFFRLGSESLKPFVASTWFVPLISQ